MATTNVPQATTAEGGGAGKVGPIAGLAFAVLFVVSFLMMDTPEGDAADAEWLAYWQDDGNRTQGILSAATMILAAVGFLWFAGALRRRLAGRVGTDASFACAIAAGALLLVAGFGAGLLPIGHEFADVPIPTDVDVIRLVDGLYFGVIFLPVPVALGGFLIPLSAALRGSNLVPRWLQVAALVIGVVALLGGPVLFILPHVLFVLWVVATSIVLLRE